MLPELTQLIVFVGYNRIQDLGYHVYTGYLLAD